MLQDAVSLPKIKPEAGQAGEVRFGTASDAIGAYRARTAGKILLISDGEDPAALAPFASSSRTLCIVLSDGDALPLFSMPDGIGGVVAAGGESAMRAARCYARVQRLTPLLLPSDAALDGVCEAHGIVKIDGEERELPLAAGEIVCDLSRMERSLSRAYARLLITRLAAFEAKALSRFRICEYPHLCEEAICAIEGACDGESVIRANAAIRVLEGRGLPRGEGATLAKMYPRDGEIVAYRALCALYAAFFEYGKPRKYLCPDYHVRAERAGISYGSLRIPTRKEYEERVRAFGRMRETCRDELSFLTKQNSAHMRAIRAFHGSVPERIPSENLKILPERCPAGLSAVMRDFGLMEL